MIDEMHKDNIIGNGGTETDFPVEMASYMPAVLTAVLVIVVCMVLFLAILFFRNIGSAFGHMTFYLHSVFWGIVIAYLLNPIMMFFERLLIRVFFRRVGELSLKQKKNIRRAAVAITMALLIAGIAVLLWMIIPSMVSSARNLLATMDSKAAAFNTWINKYLKHNSMFSKQVKVLSAQVFSYSKKWLNQQLVSPNGLLNSVSEGVYLAVKAVVDVLIGFVISVFVLTQKSVFSGEVKKIIYAIFNPRQGNAIMKVAHRAHRIFAGFFVSILINAIIVGVLTFIGLAIMNIPYALMVSVIVGVTTIIPFFGPYIGVIMGLLLICLESPVKALYFLIFIAILHQIDSSIISPKIQGESTGLSPFWIVFAIFFFGGVFGIPGIFFGIPVFAVIYYIVKCIIEYLLRKEGLSDKTMDYVGLKKVDSEKH